MKKFLNCKENNQIGAEMALQNLLQQNRKDVLKTMNINLPWNCKKCIYFVTTNGKQQFVDCHQRKFRRVSDTMHFRCLDSKCNGRLKFEANSNKMIEINAHKDKCKKIASKKIANEQYYREMLFQHLKHYDFDGDKTIKEICNFTMKCLEDNFPENYLKRKNKNEKMRKSITRNLEIWRKKNRKNKDSLQIQIQQPNATLSIPSIPRLKYPTKMDSQLTMRQLTASTNQSIIHSSLWTPYYTMQPTILPAYYQGYSNFAPPNIHHQPQSSLAQYSAAISAANPLTTFTGNYDSHQQLDQPYFLQSSPFPFPSFQNDYNLDSTEAISPPFKNALDLDYKTHSDFGIPAGGNVDLGEHPQNGRNNLTDLDQINEDELVPLVKNCLLSNYMMAEKEEFNSFK